MSTYHYIRSGSEIESAAPLTPLDRCDLIAFLGVAQCRSIDLLPITWDPILQCLGQGGKAEIREASFDRETNFAFKRGRFEKAYDLIEFVLELMRSERLIISQGISRLHIDPPAHTHMSYRQRWKSLRAPQQGLPMQGLYSYSLGYAIYWDMQY